MRKRPFQSLSGHPPRSSHRPITILSPKTRTSSVNQQNPCYSSNFAAEGVAANQPLLCRSIDRSPRRLSLRNQVATHFANNPKTVRLTVAALVRLSPSPVPRINILSMLVDL